MNSRFSMSLLVVVLVAVDQVTKWLVETRMEMHQQIDLIPFFSLYRTHNTGIAFSMLDWMGKWGLVAMTVFVIAFMLYLWSKLEPHQKLAGFGFAFVIAGALGNLIDRASFGYVVDFFLFHTQSWAFAIFNVADAFISVGAAAIIIDELFSFGRKKQTPA